MDTQENDGSGKCQVCSLPTGKSCSACSEVYYCSLDHQSMHWTVHKKVCKAYVLKKSDEVGRHYVATRNLKAGVVVLRETPVVSGPNTPPPELGPNFTVHTPCCLGCNRLSLKGLQPCSKCRLSVCSSACEKMPVHAYNECRLFQKFNFDVPHFLARNQLDCFDVFHLRSCLLKKNDPKAFKGLMNLQYVNAKEGKSQEVDKKIIERMLVNIFKISDVVTVEDWIRMMNVRLSNSSDMTKNFTLPDGSDYTTSWQYICLEATFLAHSCSPNCQFDCIPAPNMKMIVRTSTAVAKGDILTIDYYGRYMFLGNSMRRRLNDRFVCRCRRCIDPSEMGSHLSTFVCSTCKAWEMMSTNPLDDKAVWKCNSCGIVEEGVSKLALMDKLYKQVQEMDPKTIGTEPLADLISNYSGKVLHPNNWVLINIISKLKDHIAQIYDEKKELTDEQSHVFVSSSEQLISVSSLISPGITLRTSDFQRTLARVLMLQLFKKVREVTLTWTQYHKTLDRIRELNTEAYKFFKTYIDTIDGSKCSDAINIEKDLEMLQQMSSQPPLLLSDDDDMKVVMNMSRLKQMTDDNNA